MNSTERTAHWQAIYDAKPLESCSWYQPIPTTSLELITAMSLPQDAPILDVGGGDGFLVDHLLLRGFTDVTVLDISSTAIERAKDRLGEDASRVKWIVSDVTTFEPDRQYVLWHDRAAFHFLTSSEDRKAYFNALRVGTSDASKVIVATFSKNGPTKCSGTVIQQHDDVSLKEVFAADWTPIRTFSVNHVTPSSGVQEFVFAVFQRT
jgi:ubiquinone/menaquinone biosynthesis C-methylase UbiE